ncbi:cell wall-binding repeat-containing protein [Romboutsia lituseburensis]|uniref:Putative cell wall binding repeat 2 n=1 Tax=Romboutsia lituseburensis DSM 797 TaxID=1121325 RepID=A0A1G9QS74_9FIRM|nr:cell wall-binding repeat-containing protein [Romboutsia lituseburensis]CEH35628.1 Cell surface protein [Romboutsia lituseburensis]SDM13135.1 Putative cell wall binding repeat 2 [Romboutsia lituseburensis DSM 797]
MMKKKSMAVAMAAVTVAMPASQVFAAVVDNTQTEEIKAMKEKALKLMNLKYTTDANLLNNAKNSDTNVFEIQLTTPGSAKVDSCVSYSDFERKFDKAYAKLEDGQSIKIGYAYQGKDEHDATVGYNTLEDGKVVDFKLEKYTEKELEEIAINLDADGKIIANKEVKVGQIRATELSDDGAKKFEIRLSNDKNELERYKEIKVGDVEIALENADKTASRPVVRQENDYYVDVNGNALYEVKDGDTSKLNGTSVEIYRKGSNAADATFDNAQIDGFYANTGTKAEAPQIKMDVITKKGTQNLTLNASDLYNVSEGRVTVEGNDLARQIKFYSELNGQKFYGDTYRVDMPETAKDKELTIKVFKTEENSSNEAKIAEIKIVRDNKDTKAEAYKAMREIVKENVVNNKTVVAAGADRYETAAEVSRMQFKSLTKETREGDDKGHKSVVLVTGEQDKLVDGLTATPLAASLNNEDGAPILLTGNNKIAKPVLDEIERLGATKVYIVGGAISKDVEKQLEDVYGKEVERVDGDDRYDTSLEVAEKLLEVNGKKDTTEAFLVGGKGEADALSSASAAAMKKAPILLTNADKLTKDVKYFLEQNLAKDGDVYVVGGNSSVSQKAYADTLDVVGKGNIERLSGDNRQDTNAEVVERFFKNADKVVIAKSDNKGMVDALGAGLYAGKNDAPVVLATNNLTEDQEDYLRAITIKADDTTDENKAKANKVIVGNGVSSSIAKFIKDLKIAVTK